MPFFGKNREKTPILGPRNSRKPAVARPYHKVCAYMVQPDHLILLKSAGSRQYPPIFLPFFGFFRVFPGTPQNPGFWGSKNRTFHTKTGYLLKNGQNRTKPQERDNEYVNLKLFARILGISYFLKGFIKIRFFDDFSSPRDIFFQNLEFFSPFFPIFCKISGKSGKSRKPGFPGFYF